MQTTIYFVFKTQDENAARRVTNYDRYAFKKPENKLTLQQLLQHRPHVPYQMEISTHVEYVNVHLHKLLSEKFTLVKQRRKTGYIHH